MESIKIGYALTGSFCTFAKALEQMERLIQMGYELHPIMSGFAYVTDTRFGAAAEINERVSTLCGREIIHTIDGAEPIGPRNYLDIIVVAPCTGNTLGKLAWGITDTAVTMAVKAHLRNRKPVLLGVSTNDALGASAKNIGMLLSAKNIYFIPMGQDDSQKKPNSVVAQFQLLEEAMKAALEGIQLQPLLCC